MDKRNPTKNIKIRSKILEDFLTYKNDHELETDFVSDFLSDPRKKSKDSKSQNDDESSEHSSESETFPKIISEKYEEESLEDNYIHDDSISNKAHGDGIEKKDPPKTNVEDENMQTLERIVQILDLHSTRNVETVKNEISIMTSMVIPTTELNQRSYLVFFFLIMFFIIFSILKASFYILDFLKKYFEKGLILNWSWMKKHFSISKTDDEERSLLSFLIISPMLIIFLISYTGLYILLLVHKIVLDSVPDSICQKITCADWFKKFCLKNDL